MSKRCSIGLLAAFESLLLLIAFAGYGTQGTDGQDLPIDFGVIVLVILAVGNTVGLLVGVLLLAAVLHRKHHQ